MATIQTDGVSEVTSNSTVNNGGTMKANGTAEVLNTNATAVEKVGVFGSTVVDNDTADKALDAGVFAYNHSRPISKRMTTELADVATDVLKTTGSDPANIRSIHKLEVLRTRRLTTAIRANKYNRYTGQWDEGFPVVAVDSLDEDNAATPSRSVPGTLVFKYGSPTVSNANYSSKNT